MIWLYVMLFIAAFVMGMLNVPQWVIISTIFLFIAIILFQSLYPLLFEKDTKKIMKFLKKSKQPHYQFLYHFFNEDFQKAEEFLPRIRSKSMQAVSSMLLLLRQKKHEEAKVLLPQMKDSEHKWYYSAAIAYEENDKSAYEEFKGKMKDPVYIAWLEMEEKVRQGRKEEALAMLDEQIQKLRGLKLLSAVYYRNEIK